MLHLLRFGLFMCENSDPTLEIKTPENTCIMRLVQMKGKLIPVWFNELLDCTLRHADTV